MYETIIKEVTKNFENFKPTFDEINKKMSPSELLKSSESLGISGDKSELEGIMNSYRRGFVRTDVDRESENKKIDEKSDYSEEINENIATEEELDIYLDANLKETIINDKPALIREDIDYNQVDEDTGETNLEKMEKGKAPLDKDGVPIELHHIGQKADSPLAELTRDEHRGKGNDSVLHDKTQNSEIDRKEFQKEKSEHWKARAEEIKEGR
ncbi:HNH/ENDO VII family nuclease [Aliarcobacter butzleri]|uniref:HNH/ENDO VII family nuclease n=1 Tax=Aliarcobacter butzleri TaxID=28197 RepID=UPI003AF55087